MKAIDGEDYWFQNYHLILYTDSLRNDLENSIKKYLVPKEIIQKTKKSNGQKYIDFYSENITNGNSMLNDIEDVTRSIKEYLDERHKETEVTFDKGKDNDSNGVKVSTNIVSI